MYDLIKMINLGDLKIYTDLFMDMFSFLVGILFYMAIFKCIRKKPICATYMVATLLLIVRFTFLLMGGAKWYIMATPSIVLILSMMECGLLSGRSTVFKYLANSKGWDLDKTVAIVNAWDYVNKNIPDKKKMYYITMYEDLPVSFKTKGGQNTKTIRFPFKDELKKRAEKENRRVCFSDDLLTTDEMFHIVAMLSDRVKYMRKKEAKERKARFA